MNVELDENHIAFECSSLTSVTFNGTLAQWEKISKVSTWKYGSDRVRVTCIDGARFV